MSWNAITVNPSDMPSNPQRRVQVLLAHPSLDRSEVNRPMFDAIRHLDGVTPVDLYAEYPDFQIDIDREQERLLAHDVIVFQHPLYWYSTPAILKEWQDLVLEHGFAYGREGTALRGKMMLSAISAGGGEAAYRKDGLNRFTISELLRPFEQTAMLCGMRWLPPFVVHGTHMLEADAFAGHAEDYRRVLTALRDREIDPSSKAIASLPRINADLGLIGS